MEAIPLEPVDSLTVTMLVDNVTDNLLPDRGPAKRPSMASAPRIPARFLAASSLLVRHRHLLRCAYPGAGDDESLGAYPRSIIETHGDAKTHRRPSDEASGAWRSVLATRRKERR